VCYIIVRHPSFDIRCSPVRYSSFSPLVRHSVFIRSIPQFDILTPRSSFDIHHSHPRSTSSDRYSTFIDIRYSTFIIRHSTSQPIRELHQESVVGGGAEEFAVIMAYVQAAGCLTARPVLLPHKKERGSGPELPSQYGISPQ
jgi:hypothetical protein